MQSAARRNPALYQSERWAAGTLRYDFPVPNGSYTVNLKFADIYYTQSGQRVFNIALNGQPVLANFDIVASAGPNTAIDRQFTVSTTTGVITIELQSVVSNAKISAIEILQKADGHSGCKPAQRTTQRRRRLSSSPRPSLGPAIRRSPGRSTVRARSPRAVSTLLRRRSAPRSPRS